MSDFNEAEYVNKWDNVILPVMLVFIVASIIGVFAMNAAADPECERHELIYCGDKLHGHNTDH
ncbi:MAG: hypothetical protein HRU19_24080 [Pseudobacteriovorax sp.]|nr:hypothetical protein [Pseudobacteriovorax sp.]